MHPELSTNRYSLKVELRSPKPSVWVRVLVPVQQQKPVKRLFNFQKYMNSVVQFFSESWQEITNEVTWPTWSSLQSSATLVLIASIIFALIVGGMDFLINNALEFLLKSI